MRQNLDSARGLVFSGAVLLALARHGLTRQDAYRMVQAHAMATWDEGGHLYERLSEDEEIIKVLSGDELTACFDLRGQLGNVERIFEHAEEHREELNLYIRGEGTEEEGMPGAEGAPVGDVEPEPDISATVEPEPDIGAEVESDADPGSNAQSQGESTDSEATP